MADVADGGQIIGGYTVVEGIHLSPVVGFDGGTLAAELARPTAALEGLSL